MRKQTIEYICDIHECGKEATNKLMDVQVIFTTEQTEGRSIEPYLSLEKLDLCDNCKKHILMGNYVFGEGAMGNNNYWFKSE